MFKTIFFRLNLWRRWNIHDIWVFGPLSSSVTTRRYMTSIMMWLYDAMVSISKQSTSTLSLNGNHKFTKPWDLINCRKNKYPQYKYIRLISYRNTLMLMNWTQNLNFRWQIHWLHGKIPDKTWVLTLILQWLIQTL